MDSETGVESNDEVGGNLSSNQTTHFLTFSELPITRFENSAVLERKYTSIINLRGVLITLKKATSSVASKQEGGTTSPNAGSTSPQSVKITFTLFTRKVDETDFKQVVIANTTREVSKNSFQINTLEIVYLLKFEF